MKKERGIAVTIRKLNKQDFDTVLAMMQVFYASNALLIHPDQAILRRTLSDAVGENPYLEAYGFWCDEVLAGYGMVTKSYSTERGGMCIWIEDIYIAPAYRHKGYGSSFLAFVQERYGDHAARLRLEAEPENVHAMQAYQKAGFEILGYTQLVKEL